MKVKSAVLLAALLCSCGGDPPQDAPCQLTPGLYRCKETYTSDCVSIEATSWDQSAEAGQFFCGQESSIRVYALPETGCVAECVETVFTTTGQASSRRDCRLVSCDLAARENCKVTIRVICQ